MSITLRSTVGIEAVNRPSIPPLIVTAAVVVLVVAGPLVAASIDATDITTAVEGEFWADDVVDPNRIDVATDDGVVTLTGIVSNILVKERAAAIAAATTGVRAVVNHIAVVPLGRRTDLELEEAVRDALLFDPATESYEVEVTADSGRVSLAGTVDSWQERQLAETVAKGVAGVTAVDNEIEVDVATDRSDAEIEADVVGRLAGDVMVDDHLIEVEVSDGAVRLHGTVGSLAEKHRAITDGWVAGTTRVDGSDLEIRWWARDSLRRPEAIVERGAAEIERAVRDAMSRDPRVVGFQLGIDADAGTVTLTGRVDNLAAKRAAGRVARDVTGVTRVRNHLKVRPPRTVVDADLESDVVAAIGRDPFLERSDISVEASLGRIVLSGTVNTSFEKARAGIVAGNVAGVTGVLNHLKFRHAWKFRPDREIEAEIHDQLWWSPFVDADEVEIDVRNGVAILTGTVDTWSEWDAAAENAFEGGAKDVRNDLDVRYPYYGPRALFDAPMYPHGY